MTRGTHEHAIVAIQGSRTNAQKIGKIRVSARGDADLAKRATVWIDHREARIFYVGAGETDEQIVTAPLQSIHHKHPKGSEGVRAHPDDAQRFFREIGRSLRAAEAILVVGPSTAKLDFLRHVHKHQHALERRIVGVETVDHPSDGQVVAYAKRYFKLANPRGRSPRARA